MDFYDFRDLVYKICKVILGLVVCGVLIAGVAWVYKQNWLAGIGLGVIIGAYIGWVWSDW
jgi:hypothetical protein